MQHVNQNPASTNNRPGLIFLSLIAGMMLASMGYSAPAEAGTCPNGGKTLTANVVAIDQAIMFNRLGAQNVNWMVYALERDVVTANHPDILVDGIPTPNPLNGIPLTNGGAALPGFVALRPDKRPRPLVLRVAAGDCLQVNLTNLLTPVSNPFKDELANPNNCPGNTQGCRDILQIDNQVAGRFVSFHPLGMQLVDDIDDNGAFVGKNNLAGGEGVTRDGGSLLDSGESGTYTYYAEAENAYMVYSRGQPFGGEASGGNVGVGLFGVVNVQPKGAKFYRSQVTEEEMSLATVGHVPHPGHSGTWGGQPHPLIDYEATYPTGAPWDAEGKAGLPILDMVTATGEIVHSDINAIITGGESDGSFDSSTYPLEQQGLRNPALPNRLEAFREFTVVFHDETGATQAFPKWFDDPVLSHTLHGVRDSFMINYGSGGIGAEIVANRLGVGPMYDCLNCAYEEFFLTAYTVGDSAMLVDVPANAGLELCDPALNNCAAAGPKATEAFFPDDPSNVHHSYKRDFVKFRNLHAGPKEQHIFHLHNHQWLFNPNDDNSNYIDAQGIGPGSGYTYEINFGGAGNRNLSAGDAIFHCHFYPHFAQGMWEMWRIHDVFESGTELAVSGGGIHSTPFALKSGAPAAGARALPDGEITVGTPIPGVVPLPGKALLPIPGKVEVVAKEINGVPVAASVAKVIDRDINPGFPFWVAGIEETVGQRPTTPPLDMLTGDAAEALASRCDNVGTDKDPTDFFIDDDGTEKCLWSNMNANVAGGWDGGLPRHALEGHIAGGQAITVQNRLDFTKVITKAKPQYYPEEGTDLEKLVMKFNARQKYPSHKLMMDGIEGTAAVDDAMFETNGNLPVPSAPFYEPCRDDQGDLFTGTGEFWAEKPGYFTSPPSPNTALNPRIYMGANIQIDAVLNKAGYHFPQQRIIALWEDVMPTIDKTRAPEPLVMRSNTYDCVKYLHANLVPEYYELDDYQVRTPTDIIGQHIHLPKWDLVANDGSGNGWNYEDGTLSPGAVRERIEAINAFNLAAGNGAAELHPQEHPFFGPYSSGDHGATPWLGARTTIQRWFTDPVVNTELVDRGLGVVFTHDHYGPSTHQQVGLYATILAEPANSQWKHNETGELLGTRTDGGPTSWQAQIIEADGNAFREFYFEFGDFQHAYEKDVFVGIGADGELTAARDPITHSPVTNSAALLGIPAGCNTPTVGDPGNCALTIVASPPVAPDGPLTFLDSINPSYRQEPKDKAKVFPDIVRYTPFCPGTVLDANGDPVPGQIVPRPCAEAISADDVGMLVTNYRNEPIGLRVYDPGKEGPDGKLGAQADGLGGDLGFALQTRTDRAIAAFNTARGGVNTPNFAPNKDMNFGGIEPGDPYTPMVRAYPGDQIKVKIQAGSTEHEHNATIHGVKWRQAGSGHGAAPNSGWRNAQNDGISEQFTFDMPLGSDVQNVGDTTDYAYSVDSSQDGWWTGMWGIMRAYDTAQPDLALLPNNSNPKPGRIINRDDFDGVCPLKGPDGSDTTYRNYQVVAMTANQLLGNAIGAQLLPDEANARDMHVGGTVDAGGGTLVYNNRSGGKTASGGTSNGLHDPTALLYVNLDDLEPAPGQSNRQCRDSKGLPGILRASCQVQLKASAPIEPLAIRGAAGDCITVELFNKLPDVAPDLPGYNTLLQMVNRRVDDTGSLRTFQNNLIRPSSHVGLRAQLVEYDVTQHDGSNVGLNQVQTVGPVNPDGTLEKSVTYKWYAGHHDSKIATPADCKAHGVKGKGCGKGNDLLLVATPVELGGFNLIPADKIKQGQKGLVGAGVILPEGASWDEAVADLEPIKDHQAAAGSIATRGTRLSMEFDNNGVPMKDAALVFQKGLNHRFGDGTAVPNIASEGQGIPEDSHDAGQMAINYGTEPMWFRFGFAADAPFEKDGLGGEPNSHRAFSNSQVGGDPVTPVITAMAGQEVRIRVLEPTGAGRGTTFNLDGHAWQRDPYTCAGSKDGLVGRCATTNAAAPTRIGNNPIGFVLGHQESVTPAAHFDIVPLNGAGGANAVKGDYLFSDQGSFGPTSGLWGILRVQ